MKRFIVIVSASLIAFPLFGQEKSPQLKDQKDKVSYSIGMQIGFNLARQKVDINPDILAAGIKDSLADKPQLTARPGEGDHGAIRERYGTETETPRRKKQN